MATYGEVIQAITRRLNRDDLDQIAREFAVDRIDYFKKNCFYQWRITDASIATVAGVSLYNFPAGFEQVTDISLLVGSWRTIEAITYAEMMEMDVVEPPVQGVPNYWAPIGPQFRLFPAPGTAYPLQLTMDLPRGPAGRERLQLLDPGRPDPDHRGDHLGDLRQLLERSRARGPARKARRPRGARPRHQDDPAPRRDPGEGVVLTWPRAH